VAVLAAVALGMIGFFVFISSRLAQPPMGLLFGELSAQDAGQIVNRLDSQGVPYDLRSGGSQVWVPADRALKLRMSFAEAGVPRGGSVGYEIFDKSDQIGATNFVQNLNLVRALEGELARTVAALGPVAAARVHLVMPRRDLFSRERQEPTASVVIKLRDTSGRVPRAQVQAIQNLVAGAVPGMKPGRVSIIDDKGTLLARGSVDENDPQSIAATTEEMRRTHEQRLARVIEELLERTVGQGKVRAEVTADLDFDRVVTNTESFDPEGQVIRSTQTVSEANDSSESASNQGVTVANNLPDADQSAGGGRNTQRGTRTEETVNYEVTKTVRSHVREAGVIRRLSVAVIVDGTTTTGQDGQRTYNARSAEEMQRLTAIVRSAIGFNTQRGDTVEVVNLPFATADIPEVPQEEGWLSFSKPDMFRLAEILVLFIVAIMVILLVARPLLRHIFTPPEVRAVEVEAAKAKAQAELAAAQPALAGPEIDPLLGVPRQNQVTADDLIDLARVEGRVKASSMKKIGEIIEKHPDEAVAILRTWMYQEG
jgi:flagellar M-ring protein FliF